MDICSCRADYSIVCLTGALLVFEKEITRAVSPHLYTVDYTEGLRR